MEYTMEYGYYEGTLHRFNTRAIVLKPKKDGKGSLMLSKEKC